VRTLDHKLGALCRAVAVRVAEMNLGNPVNVTGNDSGRKELPIYLDNAAVEDILGVILLLFGNLVQCQAIPCGICGGPSGSRVLSVYFCFPCHCYATKVPYSFTCHQCCIILTTDRIIK
jgi:hypothetical protein